MDTTGPRAQSMTTETEALQRFYAAINRNDMQAITADFDPRIATDWMGGRFADGFALRDGRITEYVTFVERADALRWAGIEDHDPGIVHPPPPRVAP